MKKKTITEIKKKLHKVWSEIVRKRDDYTCVWCSNKNKSNHAHHIVARSIGNTASRFDTRNGLTLCYRCHMFRLKSEVDEYIDIRDLYLKANGYQYIELRFMFSKNCKWTLEDYEKKYKELTVALEVLR